MVLHLERKLLNKKPKKLIHFLTRTFRFLSTCLEWFDIDTGLVLLLDGVYDALDDDLGDVVDVTTALGGGDAVHERHLLDPERIIPN